VLQGVTRTLQGVNSGVVGIYICGNGVDGGHTEVVAMVVEDITEVVAVVVEAVTDVVAVELEDITEVVAVVVEDITETVAVFV
jgi:hypothetical protein